MRRSILFALLLLLVACAAPMASAPATVIPPSSTLPVIASETPTPEPSKPPMATIEQSGYLDSLNINWSDEHDGSLWNGIEVGMPIVIGVDKDSLRGRASGVDYVSNDILMQKALQMLRALFDSDSGGKLDGLEGFARTLADIRVGKPVDVDWQNGTKLKVFDANGNGQAEEIWLMPDRGGIDIPAQAMEIKGLRIVYGDWVDLGMVSGVEVNDNAPWFNVIDQVGGGGGVMFNWDTGELVVLIGLQQDYGVEDTISEKMALGTEEVIDWLASGMRLTLKRVQSQWDRAVIWSDQIDITR